MRERESKVMDWDGQRKRYKIDIIGNGRESVKKKKVLDSVWVYRLIWLIFKFFMDLIGISPNLRDVPKI